MGLEDILRRIREDARSEAEAILTAARAESERLRQEGLDNARERAEKISAPAAAAAEEARRKELATASVEARRVLLQAKQSVLGEVFERALEMLASTPDEQYREMLAGVAARAAITGSEAVIVSPRDRERLGQEFLELANSRLKERGLGGRLNYAAETRPMRGGFVLSAGDVEVNASFERTLRSMREGLEPEVAPILFGGGKEQDPGR